MPDPTLTTKFKGDDTHFQRVANRVEKRGLKMGSVFSKVFGGALGAGAILAGVGLGKLAKSAMEGVTAFDRIGRAFEKIDDAARRFGETINPVADKVIDLAEGLLDIVGLGGLLADPMIELQGRGLRGGGDPRTRGEYGPFRPRWVNGVSGNSVSGFGNLFGLSVPSSGALETMTGSAGSLGMLMSPQFIAMSNVARLSAPFITGERRFVQKVLENETIPGLQLGAGIGNNAAAALANSPAQRSREKMVGSLERIVVAVEENNRIIIDNLEVQ